MAAASSPPSGLWLYHCLALPELTLAVPEDVSWRDRARTARVRDGEGERPGCEGQGQGRGEPHPRERMPEQPAVQAQCGTGLFITGRRLEADYSFQSKVLGTGVSGKVRQVVCRVTGQRFAVKSLHRSKLSQKGWAAAQAEARIHLAADHPSIVRLERVYDEGTVLHLVMECLEGGEVFSRLNSRGKCSETEAAALMVQVLQAVAYLHAHHVVHSDLKPENLVYDQPGSGHVKLIDFGFAQDWDGQNQMSRKCGTLQYMAPEVLTRSYTEKIDMWSAGVLLYTLLLREHLYSGTGRALQSQVAAGDTVYAAGFASLSGEAKSLIRSLLAFEPARRPSAREALKHPWLRFYTASETPERLSLQSLGGCTSAFGKLPCVWQDRAALRRRFQAWDVDGDGAITLDDLKNALKVDQGAEAEEIFDSLDINGDGEVTWSRFLAAAKSRHAELHAHAAEAPTPADSNDCGSPAPYSHACSGLGMPDAQKLRAGGGSRAELGHQSSGTDQSSNCQSLPNSIPSGNFVVAKKRQPKGLQRQASSSTGPAGLRSGESGHWAAEVRGGRQPLTGDGTQALMQLLVSFSSSLPFM